MPVVQTVRRPLVEPRKRGRRSAAAARAATRSANELAVGTPIPDL